ncbi:MAG TPA: hypothetical protein VMF33_04815 [Acidimicrobiales bacterium]|nr:hypothetical protein [Acidimicrobiales bacterium]
MTSKKVMGRAAVALALGTALAMSTAAIAGAQGFGSWGRHHLASPRVSPFSYANNGTGGDVTAVSSTSITITEWNGTSATFALTNTTTYTEGKTSVTWSALTTGERVNIGVSSSDPSTATSVNIELAQLIGTVQSVNGNTILITDPQGFTRTIMVGTGTTYQGGSLSSIVQGTKIFAQGTVDTNGTTLGAVTIYIGTSGQMTITWGTVTAAVPGTSITIETKGGTSTLFTYTTNTTIQAIGHPPVTLTSSDLAVGEHVAVETNSTATTTAVSIWVQLVHLSGTVTGVSGDTITISDHQGFTRLILVGDMTTYTSGGATFSAGLGGITSGMHIRAEGLIDTNGTTLDALSITICATNQNQSSAQLNVGVGAGVGGGFGRGFGAHHSHGHSRGHSRGGFGGRF